MGSQVTVIDLKRIKFNILKELPPWTNILKIIKSTKFSFAVRALNFTQQLPTKKISYNTIIKRFIILSPLVTLNTNIV